MFMNLADFESAARRKMLPSAYDYFAGGALDEQTVRGNESAFAKIRLYSRVLSGVQAPETETTICEQRLSFPVIVSPTAFQGLAHPDGEAATAAAAGSAGTIMTMSTTSTCAFDEVTAAAPGRVWFQLYMQKDRTITEELVLMAETNGCRAIVLTVDVPAWGRRERDMRNGFTLPGGTVIRSLMLPGREDFYDGTMPTALSQFINDRFKFDLSWSDVEWLVGFTKLPVFVKGIIHPEDAKRAVDSGAAGIFVSNHGGRQLDTCLSTCAALPCVVDALGGRIPVIVDGGIRRGTDILKALALGAAAVGIGRPAIWGLAANGRAGVAAVLETLREEFRNAMTLCGCRAINDITGNLIRAE